MLELWWVLYQKWAVETGESLAGIVFDHTTGRPIAFRAYVDALRELVVEYGIFAAPELFNSYPFRRGMRYQNVRVLYALALPCRIMNDESKRCPRNHQRIRSKLAPCTVR